MKRSFCILMVIFLLFIPAMAFAQTGTEDENARPALGVGFQQTSWATWGLIVTHDFNRYFAGQAYMSLIGDNREVAGVRAIYRFINQPRYNIYGVGSVGSSMVSAFYPETGQETALGYGAAIGIEYDTREIISSNLPIFLTFEVGMEGNSGFQLFNCNYATITFTPGVHLRF
jgi:hypothetical protein